MSIFADKGAFKRWWFSREDGDRGFTIGAKEESSVSQYFFEVVLQLDRLKAIDRQLFNDLEAAFPGQRTAIHAAFYALYSPLQLRIKDAPPGSPDGKRIGASFDLPYDEELLVGRGEVADLKLIDGAVSREHAYICAPHKAAVPVIRLRRYTGRPTVVAPTRAEPDVDHDIELVEGDQLTVGPVVLVVVNSTGEKTSDIAPAREHPRCAPGDNGDGGLRRQLREVLAEFLEGYPLPASSRDHADPGPGRLYAVRPFASGGYGQVYSAHQHVYRGAIGFTGPRVNWIILKAPGLRAGGNELQVASIRAEYNNRQEIGEVPGLGPLPQLVELRGDELKRRVGRQLAALLPDRLPVLVFTRPNERFIHLRPAPLRSTPLAQDGVHAARDLNNWSMVARTLLVAIHSLHGRNWFHRDLSCSNVVVLSVRGFFRSIELIDFGLACRLGDAGPRSRGTQRYWPPQELLASRYKVEGLTAELRPEDEDRHALGVVLAMLLLGENAIHDEAAVHGEYHLNKWLDDRGVGGSRQEQLQDADLLFIASLRPLMQRYVNARSARVDEGLRDEFLRALLVVHELLYDPGEVAPRSSLATMAAMVDSIQARVNVVLFDNAQSIGHRPAKDDDPGVAPVLVELLRSIEAHVSRDAEKTYCDLYAAQPRAGEAIAGERPYRRALGMLRRGYVVHSAELLREIVADPGSPLVDAAEALRLLVEVILTRAAQYEEAEALLDAFARRLDAAPANLYARWLTTLLAVRLRHHRRTGSEHEQAEITEALRRLEEGLGALEPDIRIRAAPSLAAFRLQHRLRYHIQIPFDERDMAMSAIRQAQSAPTYVFAMMQLARAYTKNGDYPNALIRLQMAAAYAMIRGLVVEFGQLLLLAAKIAVTYVERSSTRRVLAAAEDGEGHGRESSDELSDGEVSVRGPRLPRESLPTPDVDALMRIGERLAAHAARIFAALGLAPHLHRAVGAGIDCAMLRETGEDLLHALSLAALAANNATLCPQEAPDGRPETRHTSALGRRDQLEHKWVRRTEASNHDPGTELAELYFHRYGNSIVQLWGGGGQLAIDLLDAHGKLRQGLLLDRLLERAEVQRPRCVVEIGCSEGVDVFRLAQRYPEARLLGLDSSEWCVRRANERAGSFPAADRRSRCEFRTVHPLLRSLTLPPETDLVVIRDVLMHVTFKRWFLHHLWRAIPPRAVVLLSDWVQRRPSEPEAWKGLLETMWLTNLETTEGLQHALRAAGDPEGFQAIGAPMELHSEMSSFFRSRMRWYDESTDEKIVQMRRQPSYDARVRATLETLIAASDPRTGFIGWVAMVARRADSGEARTPVKPASGR